MIQQARKSVCLPKKRLASVAFLLMLVWASAYAAPIGQVQARREASRFLLQRGRTLQEGTPFAAPRTTHHAPRSPLPEGEAIPIAYYVFHASDNKGYVIVSGDDCPEPIIGYVEQGRFDEANLPEGLQWLLQTYEESLSRQEAPATIRRNTPARHTVEPLMTTLWNQGNPYNILCPRYIREDGTEGDHSATGCVATAIAQVMGYYRYPAETQRYIPSYTVEYDTNNGKVTKRVDGIPAHSKIDWDNILDEYHGGETAQQDTAIAQLMHWVGVGCKMGYGPSSGAGFAEGVKALINYFGFDDGTHIESRGNFTIEDWSNLLYTEIASGHPIAFAGTNTGGAHAFVLDGYDISGLFHLNWGWGGLDNGYFRIDVLAPDNNSGIGASQTPDGYNMGQEAIIGLRLPDDVKEPATQYKLTVNDWEIRNGDRFFGNYINWSGVNAQWDMGIAYLNDEGSLVQIGSKQSYQLSNGFYLGLEFQVRGLEPGTYHVVPVSKRSSAKEWQTHVNPAITYILATVDEQGNVSLEKRPIEDITLTSLNFPGNHKVGDSQTVQAVFHNNGDEYHREIHLFASPTDDKGEHIGRTQVTIAENGETVSAFNFTPNTTGVWNIWLTTDWDGNNIVGQGSVEITAEGVAPPYNLRYVNHTVNNRSNGVIYGNRMQGKVTIMNQDDEPYEGNIHLWLFKLADNGFFYGAASVHVPVTIQPNKTAQAAYDFDHLDLNATYHMSILYEEGGDIQDGGLKQMGKTQAGIVYWQQNKQLSGMAPAASVNVPSGAIAIDMSSAGNAVKTVRPNANPNTLYILSANGQVPGGLDGKNVVRGNSCEQLQLNDDYGFWTPVTFHATHATYTRPAVTEWETIALPFTVEELPRGVTLKEFIEQDDNGNICFGTSESLQRNIPYIIYSAHEGELVFESDEVRISATREAPMIVGTSDFHFIGTTLSTTFFPNEIYDLDAENGCFRLIDARTTIKPFHAWFVGLLEADRLPAAFSFDTSVPEEAPTAIQVSPDAVVQRSTGPVYDLQGRVVHTGLPYSKGRAQVGGNSLYILKGKKVVIH